MAQEEPKERLDRVGLTYSYLCPDILGLCRDRVSVRHRAKCVRQASKRREKANICFGAKHYRGLCAISDESRILHKSFSPGWVDRVDRIVLHINVRVPAKTTAFLALHGVSCPEPTCRLVIVPCSQIVEADAVIHPLTAVQEDILGCAAGSDGHSERVEVV